MQATVPKTMQSLTACTLKRSAGAWLSPNRLVAPTNMKFQPIPSATSAREKCANCRPARLASTQAAVSATPQRITRRAPKRAISRPVTKPGANIASEWSWMTVVLSPIPKPQSIISSGVEVITRFMVP